jgi:ADP-ribose pyrophosphatase
VNERTLAAETVFDGRLLKLDRLDVELPDGRRSVREIIRHPGAVGVVARLPDERYVFVRQFRKALDEELFEIVAGTLDPGEDPEACVRREVKEETGHDVTCCRRVGTVVPAPGYSDERLHIFRAELAPERGEQETDHDETIEVVYQTAEQVGSMIRRGEVSDAKTLAAWHLVSGGGT